MKSLRFLRAAVHMVRCSLALLCSLFALCTAGGEALSDRTFMMLRPKAIPPNFAALLNAASWVAEQTVAPRKRKGLFAGRGNIYDVEDEVLFYGQAARLPNVHLIGEVGFNAGHSAIAFLFHNNNSRVVSFDVGNLKWSAHSLEFLQRLYPGRVDRVKGYSQKTVARFAANDARKFDMFAIDGDHDGEAPYLDMVNGRKSSRSGAYVLIDDWTPAAPAVMEAWARAISEGWVKEILCVDNMVVVAGARKAYCVGQYV